MEIKFHNVSEDTILNADYFKKHSQEKLVQDFYYWLYLINPKAYFKSTEYGNRYGIHPYINDQFEKYKEINKLDKNIRLVIG